MASAMRLRRAAGRISIAILLVGILSLLLVNSSEKNMTLGQTNEDHPLIVKWSNSHDIQQTIVSVQDGMNSKLGSLNSRIDYRIERLNQLLPNAVSNPTGSTGGDGSFSSECIIATAAYGSNIAPQVQFLRDFRDNQIRSTAAGSSFMQAFNIWYYSFSPSVAEYERGEPWLQQAIRIGIIPLLEILQLSENGYALIDGEAGALAAGFVASALIGMVYFGPIAVVAVSRKSTVMNKVILCALLLAGGSLVLISIGLFFDGFSSIMILATPLFVLGIMAAGATIVARLSYHFLAKGKKKGWIPASPLSWRPNHSRSLTNAILVIVGIIFSTATITAFASAQDSDSEQPLSKEEIERQLRRLGEMKTWVEEAKRAAPLSNTMAESNELTGRTADLIAQYTQVGSSMDEKTFFHGMQFASDRFQIMADRVSGTEVSERHGLLRQTLSNAIVQLSLSSGDYVSANTCQTCDAQELSEYYSASLLELDVSHQNFDTAYTMILADATQVDNFDIEIDQMPGFL